jgi:hypothetical protein
MNSLAGAEDADGRADGLRQNGRGTRVDGRWYPSARPSKTPRDTTLRRLPRLDHEARQARQVLRRSECRGGSSPGLREEKQADSSKERLGGRGKRLSRTSRLAELPTTERAFTFLHLLHSCSTIVPVAGIFLHAFCSSPTHFLMAFSRLSSDGSSDFYGDAPKVAASNYPAT